MPVCRILATEICCCIIERKPCVIVADRGIRWHLQGGRLAWRIRCRLVVIFLFQFTVKISFHDSAFPFLTYFPICWRDVLAKSEETEQEDSEDPQFPYNRNSSLCILLLKSVTDYINDSQKKATEQSTDMCGIIDSCFHAIYQIVAYEKKDTN